MPNDSQTNELLPSSDAYDSLVFSDNSATYLSGVIDEVRGLAEKGNIYPPTFATWTEHIPENGLSSYPHDEDEGRLSPAEAVAIRVLSDEGAGLAQNILRDDNKTALISKITGLPRGGSEYHMVESMAEFGYELREVIRIREKIARGEAKPTGNTLRDVQDLRLWNLYEVPLQLDGMTVRGNTISAIEAALTKLDADPMRAEFQEEKGEELQNKIKSRKHGYELSARLYKQVLDIAVARGLSASLERTVTVKRVEPLKISAAEKIRP